MASGSEVGSEELLQGALLANQDNAIEVVAIGSKVPGFDNLGWIDAQGGESEIVSAMESALARGEIDAAVAVHYPFPVGVTTIGRILTPGSGQPMLVASCTGLSASDRTEAMLRNAIYGVAVAKALGLERPTVGVLNLEGAALVQRGLQKLRDGGYELELKGSGRADGGLLRGNDVLAGTTDICVCDTLTGNVIMKLLGSFTNGGAADVLGWGYGPSVGEKWTTTVNIVSRASRASVVAHAIWYSAAVARGGVADCVKTEIAAAEAAGLRELIAGSAAACPSEEEDVVAPAPAPMDSEICGIDVLLLEVAVRSLWKAGIYAQPAMGCSGPVVRLPADCLQRAREVLTAGGYL
jgi:betaine reductase